jgi:hypothetical protein
MPVQQKMIFEAVRKLVLLLSWLTFSVVVPAVLAQRIPPMRCNGFGITPSLAKKTSLFKHCAASGCTVMTRNLVVFPLLRCPPARLPGMTHRKSGTEEK